MPPKILIEASMSELSCRNRLQSHRTSLETGLETKGDYSQVESWGCMREKKTYVALKVGPLSVPPASGSTVQPIS